MAMSVWFTRLNKSHLNDQTIESPLKKRKKSSTKIIIPQMSISTTIRAMDARNWAYKQTTQGKLK